MAQRARSMSATWEDQLFARYRAGDDHSFTELRELVQPRLDGILERKFSQDHDAIDDISQEVWIVAVKARQSYRAARFVPWLCGVCRNKCADRIKAICDERETLGSPSQSALIDRQLTAAADRHGDAVTQCLKREQSEAIREAISQLPPHLANVIGQHFFDGLSVAEIAAQNGETANTVSGRLTRAKKALRPLLARLVGDTHFRQEKALISPRVEVRSEPLAREPSLAAAV